MEALSKLIQPFAKYGVVGLCLFIFFAILYKFNFQLDKISGDYSAVIALLIVIFTALIAVIAVYPSAIFRWCGILTS
jgi:hypothetical protein